MSVLENFRTNLASVMERTGISDYALNKTTGVTRSFINRVRHGAVMPSLEYCDKLAVGVKVPLVFLIMEPERFESIMKQTIDKLDVNAGEVVQRELLPMLAAAPKKTKGQKQAAPESHRRLIWIKKLLAG